MDDLYQEDRQAGNLYREIYLGQLKELITFEKDKANRERHEFFAPDLSSVEAYSDSLEDYREKLREMLGWPLNGHLNPMLPESREEFVAEDSLGEISRVWVEALPGVEMYGILFMPKGEGPHPLIISQHGGKGTPELCSSFFNSSNYNDMSLRLRKHGCAVFAPQLLLWGEDFGPDNERLAMDRGLKQLGGSITAFEVTGLRRCLDALLLKPEIDRKRVGMIGLSYGGFYTLFMSALDTRIKAAVSSCFFNNRWEYNWEDWVWRNSGRQFLDSEIASMICPRPLYIEVGVEDDLFDIANVPSEFEKVRERYDKLGIPDSLGYKEHEGAHELDKEDDGINFLMRHLGVE